MLQNREDWLEEEQWLCVQAETHFERLDAMLPVLFPEEINSRSSARKLIDDCRVWVGNKVGKASTKGEAGDEIRVLMPPPAPIEAVGEDIPLDIVYEDADIIVVNKCRGMVVHPAVGNPNGTLVNALLYHCKDLSTIGGVIRPGIVHRIDKDTTGLLVVAKNDKAHLGLSAQLKDHSMHRIYMAVVEGIIKDEEGTVSANIGRSLRDRKKMCVIPTGREAITHYTVVDRNLQSRTTLVSCRLETGRTHQIRVHMAYLGHPVVGDPVYGLKNARGMVGQALHAYRLILRHPVQGHEMIFHAPPPEDFDRLLKTCRLSKGEEGL